MKQQTLDLFASAPKNKKEIILVIDIETTATQPDRGNIVEIGICGLDLNTGECNELFDKIIKEPNFSNRDRYAWIFDNSDLKFEEVLKGRSLEDYREEIQNLLDTYPSTAYNKSFDFRWLRSRGFKIRDLPCPMITATPIIKLPPRRPGTDFKWPSVEESWDYYFEDLPYDEAHRAYDDAAHEAKIVYEMYTRGEWKPIIEDNDFN